MLRQSSRALAATLAVMAIGVPAVIMFQRSGREAAIDIHDARFGQRVQSSEVAGRTAATPGTAPQTQALLEQSAPSRAARDVASVTEGAARRVGGGGASGDAGPRAAAERARTSADLGNVTPAAPLPAPSVTAAAPLSPRKSKQEGGAQLGLLHAGDSTSAAADGHLRPRMEESRDRFAVATANTVKSVAQEPVSTFSIDVDTASYAFARRSLNAGRLPPRDSVRVEEMINYFPYAYPRPDSSETPFRPTVTVLPSPWSPTNRLIHIAIKGYDLASAERPRANLVLLVDISGSMAPADRLPLLQNAFRMLVDQLRADDTIAIVTYAAGSDIRLKPTRAADKLGILDAIASLSAGGSTHGAAGIADAYKLAEANFDKTAVNRIILATDGDWNVGITDTGELQRFIERKRETGIFLSILGVGMGNHNDALMQALAQNGNGVAAHIDTLSEARKVLVDEASSTLFPIAKDVKLQLELNPARISEYRLIGYETRGLKREDFNNDKVDAGDIGSGHTVTAIYEVTPVGAPGIVDALRYASGAAKPASAPAPAGAADGEFGFLKLRYKLPKEETSRLISLPITPALEAGSIGEVPAEVRFSVAVAAFGQLLRGDPYLKSFGYDEVVALANAAKGDDPFGYRAEFVSLVRLAKSARP